MRRCSSTMHERRSQALALAGRIVCGNLGAAASFHDFDAGCNSIACRPLVVASSYRVYWQARLTCRHLCRKVQINLDG